MSDNRSHSIDATVVASSEAVSTAQSSSSQSPAVTTPEPSSPAKRFSMNKIRLTFSSPRKQADGTPKPSTDVPSSSNAAALPGSDEPTAPPTAASTPADQASKDKEGDQQPAIVSSNDSRPIRSALSPPCDKPSRRASRVMSPHRVSFSPSTEEMADAREQALSLGVLADGAPAKDKPGKSKTKPNLSKWRGLRSRSSSDLASTSRRQIVDSTRSASSVGTSSSAERFEDNAALPGAAAAKRRLFRWDRKGIHHASNSEKGKVAKVKVTKHQAVAARHAKTLEQVINAGMGLHPVPPRLSSTNDNITTDLEQHAKGANKNKVPRAKPVPIVDRSQLKGLKSALLDVDSANNIIKELRAMPVPLDKLRNGLGKIVPDAEIGTAGDHGQERILTVNALDTLLQATVTKDDSEIRKRPGATLDALDAATPARPPIERKAKSAAEEALRKITLQAEAATSPQKAVVAARTSSLPTSPDDATTAPAAVVPPLSQAAPAKASAAPSGARPLKMVCLDCGESEAHQRHAQHLEAATVATTGGPQTQTSGAFNMTTTATGAAAAVAGVGGLLSARSAANGPEAAQSAANKDQETSIRPPMLKSMSVSALPTLQDGQRLMGSTPLQLVLDPVGAVAQNSGAFDVLADVSGAAIRATQDMDSIHPPLDRMAIFVHWWGFEITLPKASMAYLGTAHSVSGAFLSFLQTMAVSGGVPELLPFIKYISTFMEVEYRAIQAQDQGHGVCIAGTWFMPMALVPRPWDYPLDGPPSEKPNAPTTPASSAAPSAQNTALVLMPLPAVTNDANALPKKHALKKKKKSVEATANAAVAHVAVLESPAPPKRNISPTQMAAIQAARTEKMPHDLSPRHSPSPSIASAKDAKLLAELGVNTKNAATASSAHADAVLTSVQEVPEIGSLRVKA